MAVFISHSFHDRPVFDDIVAALGRLGVPYWNPQAIHAGGDSLREQLRAAVEQCTACIFIATKHSVSSSWCPMELGAFWGAGKPIIVYHADTSLEEGDLPPVVRGDVWERSQGRVAERAAQIVPSFVDEKDVDIAVPAGRRVTAMTAADLHQLVTGAMSLVLARREEFERMFGGRWVVESRTEDATENAIRAVETARQIVRRTAEEWRKSILWVSDRPADCMYEREAFKAVGLDIKLVGSPDDVVGALRLAEVAAVVSDLSWHDNHRLLDLVQASDNWAPTFVYARRPLIAERRRDAVAHGAYGTTDAANELLDMVTRALVKRPPRSPKPSA